jgi:ubiquinone/menaquinone biosynthesis C-methylase UbiE
MALPDTKKIYQNEADRYQNLVAREDNQNNLLPAILRIDPLGGKDVIELGAGTGRLSCLLAPMVKSLVVSDISYPMLSVGKKCLKQIRSTHWNASLASHSALPFANGSADIIIAGWSFCYAAIDAGDDWVSALERALSEVERVLRPGGKLILVESLGTGYEDPHIPGVLVDYLGYLNTHGFDSTWIRTDYCFKDLAEADDLTTFFFGEDPMPMWETELGVIVPECTGLWWKDFK